MTTAFDTLVLATHNPGKVREMQDLLKKRVIKVVSAADLNLPEPEETGTSFAENAVLKAVTAAQSANLPALADDSGLWVYALNGDPGIHSARWAGPEKDFAKAMQAVNDRLGNNPDRSAAFVCVLALAMPDGTCEIFEGRVEGMLIWPPRGENGFGYDSMFIPEDYNRTYGEMSAENKKKTSHRARAMEQFLKSLKQ
jgi:non-canonical purine NTP pyrophosphatase (RdgB/HAM1 family)